MVFDLNAAQREAVRHQDGPAAVYAGPGSGKTRVVAIRAARMASAGCRLLVTTFTNDATQEMKTRILPTLPKEVRESTVITTLHSLCLQILRQQGKRFQVLTDEQHRRQLAEMVRASDLEDGAVGFLSRVSFLKNTGQTAERYQHDGSTEDIEFSHCWRDFEKEKVKRGLREFDDFILDVMVLFQQDDSARLQSAGRFTHIIVDECQDMNAPQYGLIFELGRDHRNLMLVGDPDQSLYGFRGADTQTFRRFAANPITKVYELRKNYRSTPQILTLADSLIRQDPERRPIVLTPERSSGEPVRWDRYSDADLEALAVGDRILRLHESGLPYQQMAVLYRTNAQSEAFERHFAGLEIPFTIRDEGDFYARKEIRGMLAYLSFLAGAPGSDGKHTHEDEWLLALLNLPDRHIDKSTGGHLRNYAEIRGRTIWETLPAFHAPDLVTHRALRELTSQLQRMEQRLSEIRHAGEAVRAIRSIAGFDPWLLKSEKGERDNNRLENLQRMEEAAAHYRTPAEYLKAVLRVREEAERRKAERKKRRKDVDEVTLSTGHGAKGLEWGCVFAVGWSENLLPHHKAEDLNEERRIAYVIATRARDRLMISSLDHWSQAALAPSRFLTGLNLISSSPAPEPATELSDSEMTEREDLLGGLFMEL